MDEQGRMKKETPPIFDGTFGGPDEIMDVMAMRLHQVGAKVDGAPWIGERLEWVRRRLRSPLA